jgi:hypothetical protein
MSQDIDFSAWTAATGNLEWGAQNVIHTALELAAEGKSSIVYGADYSDGGACLVNTVGQMLAVGGGSGIPSTHFGAMVREFDRLNHEFESRRINTDHKRMSPIVAEILLANFGALKDEPENINVLTSNDSDEDFAAAWAAAVSTDAVPEDEIREVVDPVKELDYIEGPAYDWSFTDGQQGNLH